MRRSVSELGCVPADGRGALFAEGHNMFQPKMCGLDESSGSGNLSGRLMPTREFEHGGNIRKSAPVGALIEEGE